MMHLVFYCTSDVFKAEEILEDRKIALKIVPTPVQDKAYCGICVRIADDDLSLVAECLQQIEYRKVP